MVSKSKNKTIILSEGQTSAINLASINEMDAREVSLSSFKVQDELHPKFWINNKLNSRVRLRLMDIADDFIKELAVDWVKPKDIIFTGSLANYNWSKYSDIDVHIIYDFSQIYNKKPKFVDDYFKSKKENWKKNHDELMIYGFPVELFVEDVNTHKNDPGRYSINKNEWIKEPKSLEDEDLDEDVIKDKVAKYCTEIDDIEEKLKKETDEHKIEVLGKRIRRLFKQMQTERKKGLKTKKREMSNGNIIYKAIRRMGYLDKIWDIYNKSYDKSKRIR